MAGVFISYRRSDTAPYAARLKAHLDAAFGDEYVFMDVDSLRPGEPFKDVIEATITVDRRRAGAHRARLADGDGREPDGAGSRTPATSSGSSSRPPSSSIAS